MFRYTTTFYLSLWNILCLGLVAVGWAYGFVGPVFHDDASRLTSLCAVLMIVTILYSTGKGFQLDRLSLSYGTFITRTPASTEMALAEYGALPNFLKSKVFLYVGLAGTVIGLSLFAKHMVIEGGEASSDSIKATMRAMQTSLQTAFYATLVGIVCKVWVEVITFIQGWTVSRIGQEIADLRTRINMAQANKAREERILAMAEAVQGKIPSELDPRSAI